MNLMDDNELKRLLRAREVVNGEPGRWCPGETELAAFVDHQLSEQDAARVERHLADCDACLELVALLTREPAGQPAAMPPRVRRAARDLVEDKQSFWLAPVLRWGAVAATAVLVAVVFNHQLRAPGTLPVPAPPASILPAPLAVPPAPTGVPGAAANPGAPTAAPSAPNRLAPSSPPASSVRKSVSSPLEITVQFPAENAVLSAQQAEFRWNAIPSASYYEVHLVTEDGNVVWLGKVEGTRARPPAATPLEAGKKYFVWIRAHLSGGGTVKSAAVSFRVGGS